MQQEETPWDAAVREAREETGLDITVNRLTGIYSKPACNEIVFNFDARVVGGKLVPTEEGVGSEYFALDRLPDPTLPKHIERIRDSARHPTETVCRTQDSPSGLTMLGFKQEPPVLTD